MDLLTILAGIMVAIMGVFALMFFAVAVAICVKLIKGMDDEYIKAKLNKR